MIKKLICEIDDHNEEIDIICYYELCNQQRLNCCKCIKQGNHNSHYLNLKHISSLREFNENQKKECDNLIDDLSKQVDLVIEQFAQLKEGIRNKYQIQSEKLLKLNSKQLNDYLDSQNKIVEYKRSVIEIITRQTNKLTQTFNNLQEKLQLSQCSYYDEKNKSKLLYDQGYNLCQQGKYKEAIELFTKSIQLDQSNYISLCYNGQCLMQIGKIEEAIHSLIRLYQLILRILFPYIKRANVQKFQAYMWMQYLGRIKYQLQTPEMLIPYVTKVHIKLVKQIGDCLIQLMKYEDALRCLNEALYINPADTISLITKRCCLEKLCNYNEALICYQKALELKSNDQMILKLINICKAKIKK